MSPSARVPLEDVRTTGRARVLAGDCAVLVTLVDDEVYAIADGCLHRGTSLAGGLLRDGVITCPAHLWRYDARTGARHDTTGEALASYPARIVGDLVEITLPEPSPVRTLREILQSHAKEPTP